MRLIREIKGQKGPHSNPSETGTSIVPYYSFGDTEHRSFCVMFKFLDSIDHDRLQSSLLKVLFRALYVCDILVSSHEYSVEFGAQCKQAIKCSEEASEWGIDFLSLSHSLFLSFFFFSLKLLTFMISFSQLPT